MSKILLMTTPGIELLKGLRDIVHKFPPLGLAYLAAFLEKYNIRVEIYDALAEDASMEDIEKKIITTDADLIGITSFTSTIREAAQIAEIAKKYNKEAIIGGYHVTALPARTLEEHTCFDYGVVGEGEVTLYELVSGKRPEEIDGLVYRQGNKVIINKKRELIEDLSIIPPPARHLLKNHLYRPSDRVLRRDKKFFTMITSRGCPYQCTFCASKIMWGRKIRLRPLEDVFFELEELKKMGMEQLVIVDDTFTLNMGRVRKISQKIKSLDIEWCCNARVNDINREMLKYLRDSNCTFIKYGVESGNQRILDMMKKGITLKQVREALKLTKEMGFKTSCSFIIGNIGETEETVEDTIRLARDLNPDYAIFGILTPYPGTEVYRIAVDNGYLSKEFEEYTNPKYSEPVLSLPGMPPERLKRSLARAQMSFYLSPKFLLRFFYNSFTSFYELKKNYRLLKVFVSMGIKHALAKK